ncbi:winged helix DNA-binding domain-containing protein, partial [Neoconidiobolus thromboides FSU 785]
MKEKQSNSQDNYTVPTFVEKLYTILQNSSNHNLICWSDDGKSFGVKDLSQFCSKVLPNYFKHGNWQSFVRQLNMYGFTKLSDAFHLSSTTCSWDFKHPDFQRDTPELFVKIRRK